MTRVCKILLGVLSLSCGNLLAADPPAATSGSPTPRPIPLTRPEMKQLIEEMKARTPRIPIPALTDDEKSKLGERGLNYEGRLRYHYMPTGSGNSFGLGGGASGEKDPAMTLENAFKVELFWIVCRTNNCQYCQGHQESKLLRAGVEENVIAALDGDWSEFTAKERAAFAFARKITYEPHRFGDADMQALKVHFTDLQILEMLMSVAGNNAINRWKEGLGVPQSPNGGGFGKGVEPIPAQHTYLTPTAPKYKDVVSKVAPIQFDANGQPTTQTVSKRPVLESRGEVEKALELARSRTPRLPLVNMEKARAAMPEGTPTNAIVPDWVRLMANFSSAKTRIASQFIADEKGDLSPLLKAQASWILARQDRAWYAVAEAKSRLTKLGQSDAQIDALDGDWAGFNATDRALFTLIQKLGTSPVVLTDDDVALALKQTNPKTVVQLVSYVTTRASFNRITEVAGLQAGK